MKKLLCLGAIAIAALGVSSQSADAQTLFRQRPAVVAAGVVVGAGSAAGYYGIKNAGRNRTGIGRSGAYGLTTVGCMVLSPMLAAAIVHGTEQRPLTSREAFVLTGNCVVPILGGLFWNAMFDANPHWEASAAPAPRGARVRARY